MQNIILFACDIAGTFTNEQELCLPSDVREINREKYIISIVDSLEKIRRLKGADKVIFSFITEEYCANNLIKNVGQIGKYLTENVCQDKHFFKRGLVSIEEPSIPKSIYEGYSKPSKIREYIKELQKQGFVVSYLIFADDYNLNFCGIEDISTEKQTFFVRGISNLSKAMESFALTIENDSEDNGITALGR